jgi:ribosomal-protein-alanine acetyltransferase
MKWSDKVKSALFRLLGKDPEAVVVCFCSGEEPLARGMVEEIRQLVPERRHYVVVGGQGTVAGGGKAIQVTGSTWQIYRQLRSEFRGLRIGLAPVLFTAESAFAPLRRAAFLLAPRRILAYNRLLERHHLRLSTGIASALFLAGVPLDRIFLRPWWLCPWRRNRSERGASERVLEGRALSPERRRIAILSPYFPYPLSHGGAVRIFYLLRELAREFDIFFFAFSENEGGEDLAPVLELCARVILLPRPRYREPKWSSLAPPEVNEFRSPAMARLLERFRREFSIEAVQVEYTQMASYGGDIVVEHDVTFDLFQQVLSRERTLSAWWNHWRWRRFETRALRRFPKVVVMSEKDARMIQAAAGAGPRRFSTGTKDHVLPIPNGVDLDRFRPEPEAPGQRLLFIGSFRHFPNIVAYRFFTEEVWPLLRDRFPEMRLTVVAGDQPLIHWRAHTGTPGPAPDARIRLLDLVRDVRPLYVEANLVLAPTMVSAGTNLKVLEAMAMERAVVSTPSGCAGLGLEHGTSVWIAGDAVSFVFGVARLISDPELRRRIAVAARREAERNFDWGNLGQRNRRLLNEIIAGRIKLTIRAAENRDLEAMARIQAASPEGASWPPNAYLAYDCRVAEVDGQVAGFLATRTTAPAEREILNLATGPAFRRRGVATRLLRDLAELQPADIFLEVRESNAAARSLYKRLGFEEAGIRQNYYQNPSEAAIVMRLIKC